MREGDSGRLRRRLEGDIDNILLHALRKEPARRYSSADQFGEDVRRHLAGLPVMARKDTVWYRAGKFVQRHHLGLSATVLIVAALAAGLFTTLWQARIALNALTGQSPGGTSGAITPEILQFNVLLWIGFGMTLYFTRASPRRVLGAITAGVLFLLLFMIEETLPAGLHHFSWTVPVPPSTLVYAEMIPFGGIIALLGWRITRRFGWRGQAAFLLAACIGGPARDYMWAIRMAGVAGVPGLLPWIANGLFWLGGAGLGQAVLRLIAGQAARDRFTGAAWKF